MLAELIFISPIFLLFFFITGMCCNGSNLILASASSDCSIKLWRLRQVGKDNLSPDFRFRPSTDLLAELELNSPVISLDFNKYMLDGRHKFYISLMLCFFFKFVSVLKQRWHQVG